MSCRKCMDARRSSAEVCPACGSPLKEPSERVEADEIPQVHFGAVETEPFDWRSVEDDSEDDDEELAETPPEIVAMLGFDPKEFSKDDSGVSAKRKADRKTNRRRRTA